MKLVLLAVLVAFAGCIEWYEQGDPVFLTDENFTAVTSHPQRYKFVKLFTPWCRYCRVLKEVVKELKNQLVERKDIEFYEVNCHLNQNTCFQLQAFSFPMTVIYGADGHLKDRIVGAMPLQVMREFVDRNTQEVFKVGGNAQPKGEETKPQENRIEEPPKNEEAQKPSEGQHQVPVEQPKEQKKEQEVACTEEKKAETKTQQAAPDKTPTPQTPPKDGPALAVEESKHEDHKPEKLDPQKKPQPAPVPPHPEHKVDQAKREQPKPVHPEPASPAPSVPAQSPPTKEPQKQVIVQPIHSEPIKQSAQKPQEQNNPPPTHQKPQSHAQPHQKKNQDRSLQNHSASAATNHPHETSKLSILAYVGIGVVMGYFLHDVLHRDHTGTRDQHPI